MTAFIQANNLAVHHEVTRQQSTADLPLLIEQMKRTDARGAKREHKRRTPRRRGHEIRHTSPRTETQDGRTDQPSRAALARTAARISIAGRAQTA